MARGQPAVVEPAPARGTQRAPARGGQRHPGWKVRQWYRNLELTPGASRDEVELAYVRLSEKYHPDRQSEPDKKRLATELAGGLREAYRGILESLGEGEDEDA
ncbi:MAG: J domain-containing protein [Sandaracinaceae bacterium]|nr:J domain-containing protein [Sandaracinaceae bacterium]